MSITERTCSSCVAPRCSGHLDKLCFYPSVNNNKWSSAVCHEYCEYTTSLLTPFHANFSTQVASWFIIYTEDERWWIFGRGEGKKKESKVRKGKSVIKYRKQVKRERKCKVRRKGRDKKRMGGEEDELWWEERGWWRKRCEAKLEIWR